MKLKDLYLIGWNTTSVIGWTYIQITCWQHMIAMMTSNINTYSLYSKTIVPLAILQSSQCMESIHTLLKLTKSNLILQFFQLGGRFNALMLCILFAWLNKANVISEEEYSNNYLQMGYVSLLLAWSLAEVIRYPFYICKSLKRNSSFLEWLRYNAFIILYPIGFAAEMRCWYGLINLLGLNNNVNDASVNYQYAMPNKMNFEISLRGWSMFIFALTPCAGAYMFYQMFLGRRKYMRSKKKGGKKQ
eukprot:431043_1